MIPLAQHLKESPCLGIYGLDTPSVCKSSDREAGVRQDLTCIGVLAVWVWGVCVIEYLSLTDDSGGPGNELADRIRPYEALPLFA